MNDGFYIGWEVKAATGSAKGVRGIVIAAILAAMIVALVIAAVQHTIGVGVFEWGTVKQFSGALKVQPYPHLLVPRPGATVIQSVFSTYDPVAPFKFGLDRANLSALDSKTVSLQGALIYRGNQTMVEAVPDSIKAADEQLPSLPSTETLKVIP